MAWLRVKICCISSVAEAKMAVRAGADALGLVSAMPSGPGVISDQIIAEISASIPEGVDSFLLTSRTNPQEIAAQFSSAGANTIQLVDWLGREKIERLRMHCPSAKIVQVLHVESAAQVGMAMEIESFVDAILLDSGRPGANVRELGGTGRTHDWNVSTTIREAVSVPVFLAGGLNAGNVVAAVRTVQPYGVDLCSGVRTDGALNLAKLNSFCRNISPFRTDRPIKK